MTTDQKYAEIKVDPAAAPHSAGRKSPGSSRFPVYVYANRNPIYDRLAKTYPAGELGARKVRKLIIAGWPLAAKEMTEWLLDRSNSFPIPDLNRSQVREGPYVLYLKKKDTFHSEIIKYIVGMHREDRQLVLRLALVRGMERPDIEELLKGL